MEVKIIIKSNTLYKINFYDKYLNVSINQKCRLNSIDILHNSNHKHTAQAKVIPNYHKIQTRYLKNTQT